MVARSASGAGVISEDVLSIVGNLAVAVIASELVEALDRLLGEEELDWVGAGVASLVVDVTNMRRHMHLTVFTELVTPLLAGEMTPDVTDKEMSRIEAIISSMTLSERQTPKIINASRKRRIAQGSGTSVQDVNALLKQFRQMQKLMKQLGSGRSRGGLASILSRL